MSHKFLAAISGTSAVVSSWTFLEGIDVLLRITVSIIGIVAGIAALKKRKKE